MKNGITTVYDVGLKGGINRTKEFEKKGLATHALNVGLLCGHGCTYCSTPSSLRAHAAFEEIGKTAFTNNMAVVDPDTLARVEKDLRKLKPSDVVQLSTTTDAWSPEAQKHGLGRACLKALLEESECQVRVLTKNSAVANEFDLIEQHRDRVLVGLSLTASPSKGHLASIYEPNASPIADRIAVMQEAAKRGLRTYGMVCPCLPGILDDTESLSELLEILIDCGAEEVFLEPVNARGPALKKTAEALARAGKEEAADAVNAIRDRKNWSAYTRQLIETAVDVFDGFAKRDALRILLYPKGLTPGDKKALKQYSSVVWL